MIAWAIRFLMWILVKLGEDEETLQQLVDDARCEGAKTRLRGSNRR